MTRSMNNFLSVALLAVTCVTARAENLTAIIPAPTKAEMRAGNFQLTAASQILADKEFANEAKLLAARLRSSTGFGLKIKSSGERIWSTGDILLTVRGASSALGAEGYELSVATNAIVIRATKAAGIFYGCQSLLQLLPPEIFSTNTVKNFDWKLPSVEIRDVPRFVWRGFMLDEIGRASCRERVYGRV